MSKDWLHRVINENIEDIGNRELEPVEVTVIDSGVDASHPDLSDRVIEAYRIDMADGNAVLEKVEPGINNDAYGHGTAVASIIARLAPNAKVIDVRVLGSDNKGSGDALIAGLRFAVLQRKSRIINMSLAAKATYSSKLFPLCEAAYQKNQIVIASKRNMPLADYGYPAEFSSAISVDSEEFPNPYNFFYRPDHIIEYVALGEEVVVAAMGGGYTTKTGTSFATPTVTGLCALLVGAYPGLRQFEIKTILKAMSCLKEDKDDK